MIKVSSIESKGTCFTIRLPAHRMEEHHVAS
jgi:signal transduction histidine kinase